MTISSTPLVLSITPYGGVMDSRYPNAQPPQWQPFNPPPAEPGVAYSYDVSPFLILATPPVTFSIVAGALPTGLTMSTAGVISGTTNAAVGGYSFTVRGSAANGAVDAPTIIQVVIQASGFLPDAPYGVSGTIGDGNALTIVGVNFGTKPFAAAPFLYWNFGKDGVDSTNALSRTQLTGQPLLNNGGPTGVIDSLDVVVGSTYSYRYLCYDAPASTGGCSNFSSLINSRDMYLFWKQVMNFTVTEANAAGVSSSGQPFNMKGFRYWYRGWPGTPEVGTGQDDLICNSLSGGAAPYGDPHYFIEPNICLDNLDPETDWTARLAWGTYETGLVQSSGIDVKDAWGWAASDGRYQRIVDSTYGDTFTTWTPIYQTKLGLMSFPQFQYNGFSQGAGKYVALDIVYLDDSFCRVVVTDSSTWSPGTPINLEIQIPTAWNDASIEIVQRLGSLGTLVGKFLWVVTADQTAYRIGEFV